MTKKKPFLSAEALYRRAMQHMSEGELYKAESDLTQAITLDPKFVPAYLARAEARRIQHKYTGTVEDYRVVMDFQPVVAQIYRECADVLVKLGRYAEAVEDYQQYLAQVGRHEFTEQLQVKRLIFHLRVKIRGGKLGFPLGGTLDLLL
jgi:Tfp pilus assembly protein PilF